jgi:hypothetical protein
VLVDTVVVGGVVTVVVVIVVVVVPRTVVVVGGSVDVVGESVVVEVEVVVVVEGGGQTSAAPRPTARLRIASASEAVTLPLESTSQTHAGHVSLPTAARSANSASLAVGGEPLVTGAPQVVPEQGSSCAAAGRLQPKTAPAVTASTTADPPRRIASRICTTSSPR